MTWVDATTTRRLLAARADEEAARASRQSPRARRRRITICTLTVLAAGLMLRWSLGIPAGDPLFYPATLGLAAVLLLGSYASGRPLRPGVDDELDRLGHRVALGLGWGTALLLVFLAGAALVAQVPALRDPVHALLDHAALGSLPVVLLVTVLNGIVEETFYRGALYDALGRRWAITVSTVVYTAVTALSGIPLLALAALLVGAGCALLRRWTRGVLAPIICHLTWSVGMLLLLDPTLTLLEP